MKCPKCGNPTAVLETRSLEDGVVNKRRRQCEACERKFNSVEINEALWNTIKRYLPPHIKGVRKSWARHERDEHIRERLRAGDKHLAVALDFGLAPNTVSWIAARAGIPAFKYRNKEMQ